MEHHICLIGCLLELVVWTEFLQAFEYRMRILPDPADAYIESITEFTELFIMSEVNSSRQVLSSFRNKVKVLDNLCRVVLSKG